MRKKGTKTTLAISTEIGTEVDCREELMVQVPEEGREARQPGIKKMVEIT